VAEVDDFDEAVGAFGLLLQAVAEAEVTPATAAVTIAIVLREILIAPLLVHRVISNSDAQATGRQPANRNPIRVIPCPNRVATPL
jgi:hypothetical protein